MILVSEEKLRGLLQEIVDETKIYWDGYYLHDSVYKGLDRRIDETVEKCKEYEKSS